MYRFKYTHVYKYKPRARYHSRRLPSATDLNQAAHASGVGLSFAAHDFGDVS